MLLLCGSLFTLRLFGAADPGRGNLHQYSPVFFRSSLCQAAALRRVLPKAGCIIFHDTAYWLSRVQDFNPGTFRYVPFQIARTRGTFLPEERFVQFGTYAGAAEWQSQRTIGGTPPNAFDWRNSFAIRQRQPCYWRWPSAGGLWRNELRRTSPSLLIKNKSPELLIFARTGRLVLANPASSIP